MRKEPSPSEQIDADPTPPDVVYVVSPEAATGNGGDVRERAEAAERDRRLILNKTIHFVAAIFLFILAIQLMKGGADAIGPSIEGTFPFDNGVSTFGLGWFGAYVVLSGSPVAATAMTFFASDALTPLQTFSMISGSRLGASFIVLLVGFLYSVRNKGRNRRESLGIGVLALSMTAIVYVPGILIGYGILKSGMLSGITWESSGELLSVVDLIWGPPYRLVAGSVPGAVLFPVGLAVILVSFKLLDRVLPQLDGERHAESRGHWLVKPWPMFALGMLAALLTLSVSVALTALVPLASKGWVKRREAIPYIAGANITTLVDTLVAAMLLEHPVGVQIVLAEAIGVTLITLAFLAFFYRTVTRGIIALDDWVVGTNRRLWLFVAALFVLPVMFMISGLIVGPIT